MPTAEPELRARIEALARDKGFARIGVARAEPLSEDAARLRRWLAAGHHGTMAYMARTEAVRADPTHAGMLPEARSVVVLAAPYARADAPTGPEPGRVARYAQGRDYHNVLHRRLRPITRLLRDAGHAARASVDTLPVLERAWAQRAGVGFIGKNCCLIVPGLGSHVFLSAIVTSAAIEPDAPMPQRCGDCTLCLERCPTRAFVAPRELDARRCIAYLTIEHRGPIEPELRQDVGDWLFGCDLCQDVCPFNRTAPPPGEATAPYAPGTRFDGVEADALLSMDEDAHHDFAGGSPLRRPGREGLARNAALVLGNAGERRALPVLRRAAEEHDSDVVRDAAAWAVARLKG
ncbi:MAG: tRNA epoxyqueuosine(34) reductase QueG [Myxococcales bacterium]|nr:tRNA epoxyqueuosine(34) reductase QueG [Myxococcales bacterium]